MKTLVTRDAVDLLFARHQQLPDASAHEQCYWK